MINFKDSIIDFCSKNWNKVLDQEYVNMGTIQIWYTPKKINAIHNALHEI